MRIVLHRIRLEVLPAIKLDDQPRFETGKVREVPADGSLPAKLAPCDLPVAQALPQALLCFG